MLGVTSLDEKAKTQIHEGVVKLQRALETPIDHLYRAEKILEEHTKDPGSDSLILQMKINNTLYDCLPNLGKISTKVDQLVIPTAAIESVDRGQNPDYVAGQYFVEAERMNDATRGRQHALRDSSKQLEKWIAEWKEKR